MSLPLKTVSKKKDGVEEKLYRNFQAKSAVMSLNRLIAKMRTTESIARTIGSGRSRSASAEEYKSHVKELILSQEDNPRTHESLKEIASDL